MNPAETDSTRGQGVQGEDMIRTGFRNPKKMYSGAV